MSDTYVPLVYFGKLPARGDFVRSPHHVELIDTLDRWLTRTMDTMSTDIRWKLVYDGAAPIHFAFLGASAQVGIAGHLVPSSDSSGRRFPFVMASTFDVSHPIEFLARSPQTLLRFWTRLEHLGQQALYATDLAEIQPQMTSGTLPIEMSPTAYEAHFADFLEVQTLGGVESLLAQDGCQVSLRQMILALGFLLQPVMAQPNTRIEKGLILPLINDAVYRPLLATLWMEFVVRFFMRGDVEMSLLITRFQERPYLMLGFNGAAPKALVGAIDPEVRVSENINAMDAEWVEDYIEETPSIKKLSDYLRNPQTSLQQVVETFREAFLGGMVV